MSTSTTSFETLPELDLRTGSWAVDPTHSAVLFSIRHLGLAKVRGRFDSFGVELLIGSSLADTTIRATVDLASINTNNTDRDAHLRSTDFFNIEAHPTMQFVVTGITGDADKLKMTGELTLNGTTRPITLDVEFNGLQEFPGLNRRHAGFSATGSLKRSEFGIDFGMMPLGADKLALGDEVKIELDLEFIEPQAEEA